MSLQSWKEEFYPIAAREAATDDATALAHSLQKWTGLRPENLQKHGMQQAGYSITDGMEGLCIDGNSCALCRFHDPDSLGEPEGCKDCPLYQVWGCSCDPYGEETYGPYRQFILLGDPEPMIDLIQEAINLLKA